MQLKELGRLDTEPIVAAMPGCKVGRKFANTALALTGRTESLLEVGPQRRPTASGNGVCCPFSQARIITMQRQCGNRRPGHRLFLAAHQAQKKLRGCRQAEQRQGHQDGFAKPIIELFFPERLQYIESLPAS